MVLSVVLCIGIITLAGCTREQSRQLPQQDTGRPAGAAAGQATPTAIPDFSGERAMGYLLRQTSFGPRNPESKGHRDCLNYLYSQLLSFADEVRLQEFTAAPYDDKKLRLTNIIASFQPGAKERLLLCAHWDTRPRADYDQNLERRNEPILGANDGASGVAVLLEIASLMSKQPPPVGVDIVLFDGEDYGLEGDTPNYLLGSRHFADTKPPEYVPRFGILLDMVGDRLLEISKEGNSVAFAPDIVELVWTTARSLNCPEFVDVVVEPITDDHVPLNEAGIKTVDLIDFRYPDETHRYWHTHEDTPDKCSAESLEAVGTVLTHVVYTQMP